MKIKGIVNSSTEPKDYDGKIQIGFTLKENPSKWYNIQGDKEELIKFKEMFFKNGTEIQFEFKDNVVTEVDLVNSPKETSTPEPKKSNSDKVVNIKGKDFVTYAGLLEKAHEKGLVSIEILESWVSDDMKMAWCKVRAKFITKNEISEIKEMFFDGFGSSTPENTGAMTQSHPVEMAHTRAKGRALRDFLNIGTAMLEELKDNK